MHHGDDGPIVLLVSRILSPFIMLFGLYVICHGHYSPGGGFQGGAMLAAGLLLVRLGLGFDLAQLQFKSALGIPLGAVGVLIFFGVGLLAVIAGGPLLDYEYVPLPGLAGADLRSMGILIIEVAIGLAVMAILVAIYDDLLRDESDA
jgi:multicomponent Na+:H+ antiporter subunit B